MPPVGIPMASYFDDFGSLLPESIARKGLGTFAKWCEPVGIGLKKLKSEVGSDITCLGTMGSFLSKRNGWQLRAALTREKATRRTLTIERHIRTSIISSHELDKLIGKLCFSQTCLFGKFARIQLRCLYKQLHAPRYIYCEDGRLRKADTSVVGGRYIQPISTDSPNTGCISRSGALHGRSYLNLEDISYPFQRGHDPPRKYCFWQCRELRNSGYDAPTPRI